MGGAIVVAIAGVTVGAARGDKGTPAADALESSDVRASSRLFTGSTNQYLAALCSRTTSRDSFLSAHSAPMEQSGIIHFNLSFAKDEG